MKTFDKKDPKNKKLYQDKAYKILEADHAFDVGLYEEKKLKNGKTRNVKSKAVLKQKIIITFSRKMLEYHFLIFELSKTGYCMHIPFYPPSYTFVKKNPRCHRRTIRHDSGDFHCYRSLCSR